jgi:hypothetical protein
VFSCPPCGERDIPETRRRTVAPPIIPVRRSSLCYLLMAFSSSKDTLFGVRTLLQRRLQRNGAKGFLRATKGVLGAMPFVVAVLESTIAVSTVFVMYLLVRRWL